MVKFWYKLQFWRGVKLTFYVLWIVLKTKNNRICESIKEREGATFWIIETFKTRQMCKKCTSLTLTIHSISISYFSSYTSAFSKRNYQMFWYIGHKYKMIVQKMYLTALAGQWPNPYCHLHHVFINTKNERTTEDMRPEVSKKWYSFSLLILLWGLTCSFPITKK